MFGRLGINSEVQYKFVLNSGLSSSRLLRWKSLKKMSCNGLCLSFNSSRYGISVYKQNLKKFSLNELPVILSRNSSEASESTLKCLQYIASLSFFLKCLKHSWFCVLRFWLLERTKRFSGSWTERLMVQLSKLSSCEVRWSRESYFGVWVAASWAIEKSRSLIETKTFFVNCKISRSFY